MDDVDFDESTAAAVWSTRTVAALMGDEIVSVPESGSLRDAAVIMRQAEVGLVVIGDADNVRGVVSERDIVAAAADGTDLESVTLDGLTGRPLKWAMPESALGSVIDQMMEGYVRHILVGGADGRLVGIVSMRDLVAAMPA